MNWSLPMFSLSKSSSNAAPANNTGSSKMDNLTKGIEELGLDKNSPPKKSQPKPDNISNEKQSDKVSSSQAEKSSSSGSSSPDKKASKGETVNYEAQRMIGHGSFGTVFTAKIAETGTVVAIKKVLQDSRFKNRELIIMKLLAENSHPFIVKLINFFGSKGGKSDEIYLNLVLEFVPETLHSVAKFYQRRREVFPIVLVRTYMYQLSRALAHIHGMDICHRDVKPQNLLVNPSRCVLKLCDFGSAKILVPGEPNIAYICSRFYRAPELIFGATNYTVAIDVWSQGCVFAELLAGCPIFPGSSGTDQLVEIVKVLGTPSREEINAMNPNYQEFKFPSVRSHSWNTVIRTPGVPAEALDLIDKTLKYIPSMRLKAIETCAHSFYDPLRLQSKENLENPVIREYFEFTESELSLCPEVKQKLLPECMKNEKQSNVEVISSSNIEYDIENTKTTALEGEEERDRDRDRDRDREGEGDDSGTLSTYPSVAEFSQISSQ